MPDLIRHPWIPGQARDDIQPGMTRQGRDDNCLMKAATGSVRAWSAVLMA